MLRIKVSFCGESILMQFSSNEKLSITYMKDYSKQYSKGYDESLHIASLEYRGENTLELFKAFAGENERLRYCVDFNIDKEEYKNFRQNIHKTENMRWKLNALAKLFDNYFSTLECTPQNNLSETRQEYLVLVKLCHPDFQRNKSAIERAYCRKRFEKIQVAYDNFKALYKDNT